MSNTAASFVQGKSSPRIRSSTGSKHGDPTITPQKEHQPTNELPPFASRLPSPLDKEALQRLQDTEQAVKDAVIESLEDDDIDHTSVVVKIDVVANSFYADVQIVSDDAAEIGDNSSEQLDYILYAIVKELGDELIKSITGRVRTTDEVKRDEVMSRRIKEGVVREKQHNLKNMAVSNKLGDVTNTPTKPSAKAKATTTIYPAAALALDEGSHVVNYKPPVFSTISNNYLQDLHICTSGTFPYKDGEDSFMGVDKGKGEIINAISKGGGTISINVTNKTHVLVIGERPGQSKVRAAMKKEILIIDLASFHQLTTGSITIEALRKRENAKPTSFSRVGNAAAAKKSKKKKSSTSTKKRKRVVTPKSCGTGGVVCNDSDYELEDDTDLDDMGLDDMEHLCVGYFQSW